MNLGKRVAALSAATIVLSVPFVAAPAFATDATVSDWSGLAAAAGSSGTITLGADISGAGTLALGGDVTLDLAGHALSIAATAGPAVSAAAHTLTIEGPGTFTATGAPGPTGPRGTDGTAGVNGILFGEPGGPGGTGGAGGNGLCGVPAIAGSVVVLSGQVNLTGGAGGVGGNGGDGGNGGNGAPGTPGTPDIIDPGPLPFTTPGTPGGPGGTGGDGGTGGRGGDGGCGAPPVGGGTLVASGGAVTLTAGAGGAAGMGGAGGAPGIGGPGGVGGTVIGPSGAAGAPGIPGGPGAVGPDGVPAANASYSRSPVVTTSGRSVTWVFSAPAAITAVPSAAAIDQGRTVTIATHLRDSSGVDLGDVSSLATITSDIPSDTVAGDRVTFHHASVHTLTISYGGFTTTVAIQVRPLAGSAPELAATGLDALPWLGAGAGLLALGVIGVVAGGLLRRRSATAREAEVDALR